MLKHYLLLFFFQNKKTEMAVAVVTGSNQGTNLDPDIVFLTKILNSSFCCLLQFFPFSFPLISKEIAEQGLFRHFICHFCSLVSCLLFKHFMFVFNEM